jgi:hypothetical protein
MELETRTTVRAHQGLGEEAGPFDQAREGDRCADRQQDALGEGRDQVVVRLLPEEEQHLEKQLVAEWGLLVPQRRHGVAEEDDVPLDPEEDDEPEDFVGGPEEDVDALDGEEDHEPEDHDAPQ